MDLNQQQQKQQFAIKIQEKRKMSTNRRIFEHMISEIQVHWKIEKCDGMLGLQEIFEDTDYIYLVLDYQEGGSMLKQIETYGNFTEPQTKIIMQQLLLALDYLHKQNIVHRDIKLDNILVNRIEGERHLEVKIADFGIGIIQPQDESQKLFEKCGTPGYLAPEMLRGQGYREKADIFSLGSVFFNLVTGRYLFTATNASELL